MQSLSELNGDQIKRVATALERRDAVHRGAIVDLLNHDACLDQIVERLGYRKPKAIYELARRFEVDTGVRFPWPWRKDKQPGPKLSELPGVAAAN